MNKKKLERKIKLLEFALVFAAVPLVAFFLFPDNSYVQDYALWISLGFLGIGILFPTLLRPLEFLWMKLSVVLGGVSNRILLTLIFFLVLTPMAWLQKLFASKKPPPTDSYWVRERKTFDAQSLEKKF